MKTIQLIKFTSIAAATAVLLLADPDAARGQDDSSPGSSGSARSAEPDQGAEPEDVFKPAPPRPGRTPLVIAQAGGGPGAPHVVYADRLATGTALAPGGSRAKTLVITPSETDPKAQASLQEDFAVMSHILQKALNENAGGPGPGRKVMGIDVLVAPGAGSVRNLYLDGYGALFLLNVSFPLVPPPTQPETQKEETQTDSTWDEARQELYGQEIFVRPAHSPGEGYSEEKLNQLKDALFEVLKNATHIRGLKPEDCVTVCVTGGSSMASKRGKLTLKRGAGFETAQLPLVHPGDMGQASSTVLTIRVKKTDVDAFAKGKMNLDEFRNKARVAAYVGVGGTALGRPAFEWGFGGGDGAIELQKW